MLEERWRTKGVTHPSKRLVIRTGCLGCRARGFRCDPSDENCQLNSSTEWTSNRRLSRRPPAKDCVDSDASADGSQAILSLNITWPGTLRERESLHFFCVISAPELSGFLDTKFWQQLLPQATILDQAIKHAVAALGASHEYALRRQASRLSAETDGLLPFAIRQCNKAINNLLRPSRKVSQGDLMRVLTASVLFASFESLSGNRKGAIPHVVHSRRLIEEHKKRRGRWNTRADFPVDLNAIEPLVAHYELQIGSYVYEDEPEGMLHVFDIAAPLDFCRLADARVSLEQAIGSLSVLVWSLPGHHSAEAMEHLAERKAKYALWLDRWDAAFTTFLSQDSSLFDQGTLDGCRLLKAHHIAMSTMVDVNYASGEAGWASFTPRYRTIVELISTIVDNLPKRGSAAQAPQMPYLSSTMGMTEPLYCVATRCTDPAVAEKARALMKKLPLNEGVHSAWKIAYIEKTLCAATGKHYPEDVGGNDADFERSNVPG